VITERMINLYSMGVKRSEEEEERRRRLTGSNEPNSEMTRNKDGEAGEEEVDEI
jgi:hypothetical protein